MKVPGEVSSRPGRMAGETRVVVKNGLYSSPVFSVNTVDVWLDTKSSPKRSLATSC